MPLTTVRVEQELLKQAKALGLNVSEAARDGIKAAIRKKQMLDAVDWGDRNAIPTDEPSEVVVRRMRDERSAHLANLGKAGKRNG